VADSLPDVHAMLGEPLMTLTFDELGRLRHPLVYVWSRGDQVIYVGCSANGVERPLAKGHEKLRGFCPGDTLTIWRCVSPGAIEAELIALLRPSLNAETRRKKA
jgi:hypothetical protein